MGHVASTAQGPGTLQGLPAPSSEQFDVISHGAGHDASASRARQSLSAVLERDFSGETTLGRPSVAINRPERHFRAWSEALEV
jgi:hypothetical protein